MVYYHVLVVTVLILASSVCTLTTADEVSQIKITSVTSPDERFNGAVGGRLLRTSNTIDSDPTNSEEKALPSFITSRITRWRIKTWITAKKSDNYVKRVLGMEGLTGAALTSHPKSKTYQKFKLGDWLKKDTSTAQVWDDLGMAALREADVPNADGFGTYFLYMLAYDRKIQKYKNVKISNEPNIGVGQ